MKIWTLGAKVPHLDREIAFVEAMGGSLVLDDRIPFGGTEFRVPLLRLGDKYLHIAEEMASQYPSAASSPLTLHEAAELRGKLAAWEDDWNAPGMEAYDRA